MICFTMHRKRFENVAYWYIEQFYMILISFRGVGRCCKTVTWLWISWMNYFQLSLKQRRLTPRFVCGSPQLCIHVFPSPYCKRPLNSLTILHKDLKLDLSVHTPVSIRFKPLLKLTNSTILV